MKGGLLAPNLVTEMIEAFARGARMNIDLSDAWDYWPVMDRPLEEVRRLYHIDPIQPVPRTERLPDAVHA